MKNLPCPTFVESDASLSSAPDFEHQRWQRLFAGEDYFYGHEPGPLARRAVRYHRAFAARGTALDIGCGEGQDLAFLASCGYEVTGFDFIPAALDKARKILQTMSLNATICECDLRKMELNQQFDLVLASNSLQFLGNDAPECLNALKDAVAPGGVIGVSLFAREEGQNSVQGSVYFTTLNEILALFQNWQPLEATTLYQWNLSSGAAQPFVTLIARNIAPTRPALITFK